MSKEINDDKELLKSEDWPNETKFNLIFEEFRNIRSEFAKINSKVDCIAAKQSEALLMGANENKDCSLNI